MKNRFFLSVLLLLVVLGTKAQEKDIYFITVNNYAIIQKMALSRPEFWNQ